MPRKFPARSSADVARAGYVGPVAFEPSTFDVVAFANSLVLKSPPLPLVRDPTTVPVFINALDGQLRRAWEERNPSVLLPNLHEHVESISIFSDYGGDEGRFRTYSFLLVGWNALHGCFQQFKLARERHGLNDPYKEIAYKDMRYGPQARALDDILAAAEFAPGLLFNLIVAADVASVIADNSKTSYETFVTLLRDAALGEWKGAVTERLLRVMHSLAYLTALLAREGQKVVWMTDHDAIVPNEGMAKNVADLFQRILRLYARVELGTIGYALAFKPAPGEPDLRDLLSIADLAAGSIAEFYTATAASEDPSVKESTNKVLMWLSRQGIALKKLNFVVRRGGDGRLETAIATFVAKDAAASDVRVIPITL